MGTEKEYSLLDHELIELRRSVQGTNKFDELFEYSTELFKRFPDNSAYLDSCIYAAVMKEDWENAIYYAKQGLEREDNYLNSLAALSHAYYGMKDLEKCCKYGSQILYHQHNQILETTKALPKLIDLQKAPQLGKKIISFSLFGNSPKYIESAVINTELVEKIYPGWICRFYIDENVPADAIKRLSSNGAEIFTCHKSLHHIPKTMWRFLPLADPSVSYVIFRDADSVISRREAAAVNEWLESGKYFHTLRDNGSQTDLVQAGLWGAVCGVLPNVIELMNDFVSKGNLHQRFADQDFLKQYLWVYIIQSLYATDSVFDFLDSYPFPIEKNVENFVGRTEPTGINVNGNWSDGAKVKWQLYSKINPLIEEYDRDYTVFEQERFICEYESIVNNGKFSSYVPRRYAMGFDSHLSRLDITVIE